jgi:hypothetical protein
MSARAVEHAREREEGVSTRRHSQALEMYYLIEDEGLSRDVDTYNCLIAACANQGEWRQAESFICATPATPQIAPSRSSDHTQPLLRPHTATPQIAPSRAF